jgi:hypothetical protein
MPELAKEAVPSIAELAQYGVMPGVLVAVVVVGSGLVIWVIVKFMQWTVEWHSSRMDKTNASHAANMDRIHSRLDLLFDCVKELKSMIARNRE